MNTNNNLFYWPEENLSICKEKQKNKNTFLAIHFGTHPTHYSLLRSIQHLFVGESFRVQNVLYIPGNVSVKLLRDYSDVVDRYATSLQLIRTLTRQIQYLKEKENAGFYTIDYEKVLVINDAVACYFSGNHLKRFSPELPLLQILSVPEKDTFLSPEFVGEFAEFVPPISVSWKAVHYSLGKLILVFLDLPIDALYGTKLFGFLTRCMHPEIEKRIFLWT